MAVPDSTTDTGAPDDDEPENLRTAVISARALLAAAVAARLAGVVVEWSLASRRATHVARPHHTSVGARGPPELTHVCGASAPPWLRPAFESLWRQQHPRRCAPSTLRAFGNVPPDEGVGSVILAMAGALDAVHDSGRALVFDDLRGWSFGGGGPACAASAAGSATAAWDCLFAPISSCTVAFAPSSPAPGLGAPPAAPPATVAAAGGTADDWRAALPAYLLAHATPATREALGAYGGLPPGRACVGVHLRLTDRGGGDDAAELAATWAGYAAAVTELGDARGADCVLLATDAEDAGLDALVAASLAPRFAVRRVPTRFSRAAAGGRQPRRRRSRRRRPAHRRGARHPPRRRAASAPRERDARRARRGGPAGPLRLPRRPARLGALFYRCGAAARARLRCGGVGGTDGLGCGRRRWAPRPGARAVTPEPEPEARRARAYLWLDLEAGLK